MAKAAATSGELALTSSQRVFNFSISSVFPQKILWEASVIIRTSFTQPQTKALAAKATAEKDVRKEDQDAGSTDGETPEHKAGDQVVTDEPVAAANEEEEGKAKQQRLRHLAWRQRHQRELEEAKAEARRCCICLCLTALVCLCWAA